MTSVSTRPPTADPPAALRLARNNIRWLWERVIEGGLFLSSTVAIAATIAILYVLVSNSYTFFQDVSILEFLTGTKWNSDPAHPSFGVLPLVVGSLMVTVGSALFAVPIGLATAIYLSEFAPARIRSILKPTVEVLAGIPSVAFGLFAVLVVSPILQDWFNAEVFNVANAVVVLTFMVLPIVTSLSEDALRAVPRELREGAFALGATKWEVSRQVVVPAALSGIVAAVLLGFARAIGETMAVTLAAGSISNMSLNFFEAHYTMPSFIAIRAQGDVVQEGPAFYSLFAVGLALFLITFATNMVASRILRRYREAY